MSLDTRLLSGLIALEKQYIKPDDLVAAFRLWRIAPRLSLGEILISQGRLSRVCEVEIARHEQELATDKRGETDADDEDESQFVARSKQGPVAGIETSAAAPPPRYRPTALHRAGGLGEVYLADDLEVE